jgi:hypothetical protein
MEFTWFMFSLHISLWFFFFIHSRWICWKPIEQELKKWSSAVIAEPPGFFPPSDSTNCCWRKQKRNPKNYNFALCKCMKVLLVCKIWPYLQKFNTKAWFLYLYRTFLYFKRLKDCNNTGNVCNATLWSVRVIFISPSLFKQPDAISFEASNFVAI